MEADRILIFKHIFFFLKEWFKEYHHLNEEQFEEYNDFSTLKIIKLDFLVTAINSHNDSSILDNSEYYAMPYGPVETRVYNSIRNQDIIGYNFSKHKVNLLKCPLPQIDFSIINSIKTSIDILKGFEPNLINADAGSLVELTHKWNCWKKNYALARAKNLYSSLIPNEDIKNDIKILNLDLL